VGTLEPRKNVIALIKAFGNLKKKNLIEHSLVLCGPKGWYYQEVFNAIKEWRLEKDVLYKGYIPESDLPSVYNLAQIFVYPSIYEGFGLPVLEAMACGCPVITSNAASLPEVVGNAAILVDPENNQELEQSLLQLINDEDLRRKLSADGIKRAGIFSYTKSAETLYNVLKRASL
jgi:glycosyltransferase involved in cell wall biosynthesis